MASGFAHCLSLCGGDINEMPNRLTDICGMFQVSIFHAQKYTDAAWKWQDEGSKITKNKKDVKMGVPGAWP